MKGNVCAKLHQRVEFLWKVGTVFFMMCWTCAVFVNICYVEWWHVKKKECKWTFPVPSSIWRIKTTNPLTT